MTTTAYLTAMWVAKITAPPKPNKKLAYQVAEKFCSIVGDRDIRTANIPHTANFGALLTYPMLCRLHYARYSNWLHGRQTEVDKLISFIHDSSVQEWYNITNDSIYIIRPPHITYAGGMLWYTWDRSCYPTGAKK